MIALVTIGVAVGILVPAFIASHLAPKGGWDYTEHHARQRARSNRRL
jgi:hypothetical protein